METKKLLHVFISLFIFIALGIGANCLADWRGVILVLAMALQVGQAVWLYGRNWKGR